MQLIQTIAPTAEPVAASVLRDHCSITGTDHDTALAAFGQAARRYVELFTQRQLVAAMWQLRLDRYWSGSLWLPYPPLLAVTSVQYVDTDGNTQTETASVYDVDANGLVGRVMLGYSQSWSSPRSHPNAVIVTFRAGFAIPFTAVAGTDVLTWSGHTPTDGERVRLSNSGGALPAGLSTLTDYFVIEADGSTCKLSTTSGGSKVDITDAGTGTHFVGVVPEPIVQAMKLLVGHWFEHRKGVSDVGTPKEVPLAVKSLLWSEVVED